MKVNLVRVFSIMQDKIKGSPRNSVADPTPADTAPGENLYPMATRAASDGGESPTPKVSLRHHGSCQHFCAPSRILLAFLCSFVLVPQLAVLLSQVEPLSCSRICDMRLCLRRRLIRWHACRGTWGKRAPLKPTAHCTVLSVVSVYFSVSARCLSALFHCYPLSLCIVPLLPVTRCLCAF